MAFNPAQMRAHRDKLKAKGICQRCHRLPAGEGVTICAECRERLAEKTRERCADKTVCSDCARKLDLTVTMIGGRYCGHCLELGNNRRRRKYARTH